ncbi:hypothetical protein AOA80_04285 [Methanomassiliicoccales archaeon RumEn M1]|jgi:putative RecB family exonuclease|nr:hypothetical protein AOA80_04285 [Methanomassiliicoccales archaeon RumEn M1]
MSRDILKNPLDVARATEPYSHSRLSVFEQCPRRYKLRYIDKVEVEESVGIEAFTGSLVHESLEHLYAMAREGQVVEWDELASHLRNRWDELYDSSVFIARKDTSPHEHLLRAQNMLMAYYRAHRPFQEGEIVGLEHELRFCISGKREHEMIGYMDRLTRLDEGVYEIHDYKTGKRMPSPAAVGKDRQLALYEIGVRRSFPDVREVRLIWHYLAHDKHIRSRRSAEQLARLEAETSALIETIEECDRFPRRETPLCRWCEYCGMCEPLDNDQ